MAPLKLISLADVKAEQPAWLWKDWIARGVLTFMVGEPGVGKSSISWDLLARHTSGAGWPDGSPSQVGRGLVISGEDHLASWIVPQLRLYGADIGMLHSIDLGTTSAGERTLRLDTDCGLLEAHVRDSGVSLVVIDPLDAFLGEVNPNHSSEIRRITTGLVGMAARTGAAVVVLHHFNKNEKGSTINRVAGSVDIVGAARTVLYVVGDQSSSRARAVFVAKSNLGQRPRAMLYEQESGARLRWSHAPEGFDGSKSLAGRRDGVVEEAEAFLVVLMEEHDGEVRSSLILDQARDAGISKHALDRAKASLGIRSERRGGSNGYWVFCVHEQDTMDDVA